MLGATILDMSAATRFNTRKSGELGWSVNPDIFPDGPGSPDLAAMVYEFQHRYEDCPGSADPFTRMDQCYNRDGMIGDRTLQAMANVVVEGDMGNPDYYWISESIVFPAGMLNTKAEVPKVRCGDMREDLKAQYGCPTKAPAPPPSTQPVAKKKKKGGMGPLAWAGVGLLGFFAWKKREEWFGIEI